MWNMAYYSDQGNAIDNSCTNQYREYVDEGIYGVEHIVRAIDENKEDNLKSLYSTEIRYYGRYWQGMTVIIFPLLLFFT